MFFFFFFFFFLKLGNKIFKISWLDCEQNEKNQHKKGTQST